jgi:hypothetical protein
MDKQANSSAIGLLGWVASAAAFSATLGLVMSWIGAV